MGAMSQRHLGSRPGSSGTPARAVSARLDYPLLTLGVVAVSFSAVLIRWADTPGLSIALYRDAIAAAMVVPLALLRHRHELARLTRRQVLLAVTSGAMLAAHFATWIPSLSYTTVAASVVLVTTQPVWTALAGRALGERMPRAALGGIAVAMVGAGVVSVGDFTVSSRAAFGDALALVGAVTAAGYFLVGRNLRQELSLVPYVAIVYTSCAVLLVPVVAIAGQPFTGFPARTWGLFVLMALVPHIMGHTVFNYLLRHIEATVVAIAIMGEPVGASLLALAFFGEVPRWTAVAGGALILAGIYAAITRSRRAVEAPLE
jgi:drug/metabolite transporter (DMT)-like permease